RLPRDAHALGDEPRTRPPNRPGGDARAPAVRVRWRRLPHGGHVGLNVARGRQGCSIGKRAGNCGPITLLTRARPSVVSRVVDTSARASAAISGRLTPSTQTAPRVCDAPDFGGV